MITLSDLSKIIQTNNYKSYNGFELKTNEFIQTSEIPKNIHKFNDNKIHADNNMFKYDNILEIPNTLNFLNKNDYYMFCTENYFYSIFFALHEPFRLGLINRTELLNKFKQELISNINTIFLEYNEPLKMMSIKKETILSYLNNILYNHITDYNLDILQIIAYHIKHNIYIIDPYKLMYHKYVCNNNSDNNIILILEKKHIIPLSSIKSTIFSDSDTYKILSYLNPFLNLKNISQYKLSELQSLSNQYKIPIIHNNKKQTKLELYTNLSLIT